MTTENTAIIDPKVSAEALAQAKAALDSDAPIPSGTYKVLTVADKKALRAHKKVTKERVMQYSNRFLSAEVAHDFTTEKVELSTLKSGTRKMLLVAYDRRPANKAAVEKLTAVEIAAVLGDDVRAELKKLLG